MKRHTHTFVVIGKANSCVAKGCIYYGGYTKYTDGIVEFVTQDKHLADLVAGKLEYYQDPAWAQATEKEQPFEAGVGYTDGKPS